MTEKEEIKKLLEQGRACYLTRFHDEWLSLNCDEFHAFAGNSSHDGPHVYHKISAVYYACRTKSAQKYLDEQIEIAEKKLEACNTVMIDKSC